MIDRDKMISRLQIIRTWAEVGKNYNGIQGEGCLRDVVDWIDDALELLKAQEPRVLTLEEVEQRTGRWETVYGDHISAGHRPWAVCCSECGMIGGRTRYCSNCGAKMEQNDETD